MDGIERIVDGETLLALIVRSNFHQPGIVFFTPNELSQQLAYMNRPAGYRIAPHYHNPVPRQVIHTRETLFIRSGAVRVDIYSENNALVVSVVLKAGDVILLVAGGHGFEMLEPTEMLEVKQGPYIGENDKSPLRNNQ